ncbi:MAG: hypothetical protein IJS05_07705, partial [Paludibacteraceae bacterium]|nr:hypothetical protein [Paludibacteraceae bacterium]
MAKRLTYDTILGRLRKEDISEEELKTIINSIRQKSNVGHTHATNDITDFEESVEALMAQHGTGEATEIHDVIYVADLTELNAVDSPTEDALYITEDTGFLYKYRESAFVRVEDETYNTIIVSGTFNDLSNRLKSYHNTGTWDVVLIQTGSDIATYRFICTARTITTGKKIQQTLVKDQRNGVSSNTRTRTGTYKTSTDTTSWGGWTLRTPLYQETLDTALSATSDNAVRNSAVKAALDLKADTTTMNTELGKKGERIHTLFITTESKNNSNIVVDDVVVTPDDGWKIDNQKTNGSWLVKITNKSGNNSSTYYPQVLTYDSYEGTAILEVLNYSTTTQGVTTTKIRQMIYSVARNIQQKNITLQREWDSENHVWGEWQEENTLKDN